jgi:F-type H+-transporting ATPase subunit b
MPQFDLATFPSQIFWLCIIFFVQYLITAKVIVPGFKKIYSTRKDYINEQVQFAQKTAADAEKIKNDYEAKLEQAKTESAAKMTKAMKEVQITTDQKISELDSKLAQDLKVYEKKLADLRISMKDDLDDIAASSAITVLNKISNITVTKKNIEKYIN